MFGGCEREETIPLEPDRSTGTGDLWLTALHTMTAYLQIKE